MLVIQVNPLYKEQTFAAWAEAGKEDICFVVAAAYLQILLPFLIDPHLHLRTEKLTFRQVHRPSAALLRLCVVRNTCMVRFSL